MSKTREYTNGAVTVVWKPELCIHSGICAKGLPDVFRPRVRPWVRIEKGTTEDLINQVKRCPSGALSYYLNEAKENKPEATETKVEVLENGPLLVYGTLKVIGKDGTEEVKNKTTAFCRCGASKNKPYCDGTHSKTNFTG
ncbi:(4Fe-4S)-binding protein [Algibacter luteus]|uniref:Zn-finger domain of CDGSH type-containing protein n=1 Tax=Algibacter luteus TaxID=1178825 RepID=A0A1M6GAW2_9FLAO|nr:(4Fe-4S)-binding protein [Algibacter luteus]SHJ07074.1 Zn-finger domain of CDGSH type-containing protein [Algibacter luteus]